jgi:histidinol-phosphate phosphatase family protein
MQLFKPLKKSRKNILLFVDRDGTLIYDDNYFLGKDNYWKSKIKILPKVVEGMKLLDDKFPNKACRFIITNQPGVAIKDFKRLTMKRAKEVTKEVQHILKRQGAYFDNFVVCGHVTPMYVAEHKQFKFDKKYIDPMCDCFKPNTGMIEEAAGKKGLDPTKSSVYVIGDRQTDVLTALKAKGTGILIPFENRPGEIEKVKQLKKRFPKQVFIAKDFLEVVKIIISREK